MARRYRGGMSIGSIIAGSPEQMAERFAPCGEIGYDEMVRWCMTAPRSAALETISLLGKIRGVLR